MKKGAISTKHSTHIAAFTALLTATMLGGPQLVNASEKHAPDLARVKIEWKYAVSTSEKISDDKAEKVEFDEEQGNPRSKSGS